MTRTPGAGQQRESPPAWRCQITVRQPGRPHSEKSGFESRWVESEAWPSPDLKQFVGKLLHQGGDAPSRKGASTHKDLIRLAAAPERASEEGLKRVNKQPARPRASCWENLPPRLRPCWDDGIRLSALRWEEPRVILTGLPPASTEAAAFWTRVHGSPLATSHWKSTSTDRVSRPRLDYFLHSETSSIPWAKEGRKIQGQRKEAEELPGTTTRGALLLDPVKPRRPDWTASTVIFLPGLAVDYPQRSTLFQKSLLFTASWKSLGFRILFWREGCYP